MHHKSLELFSDINLSDECVFQGSSTLLGMVLNDCTYSKPVNG